MSVRVMTWVWDHSRSKKTDRLVLLAIADCCSDDGSNAYPSMSELVRKTGLSERGVQTSIGRLIALKELRVHRNAGPGGCNRYRVIMTPAKSAPPADPAPPARGAPPAESAPAESAPSPRRICGAPPQNLHPTPAESAPGTVLEPSIEPSIEPSTPPHAAEVVDGEIIDATPRLPAPAEPENAGTVTRQWIDHCARRGVKLTNSIIKRYAKGIGDALTQGFHPNLVKAALAQMLDDCVASRPSLLDNYLVRAQQGPELPPRRASRTEASMTRSGQPTTTAALIRDALTRPA